MNTITNLSEYEPLTIRWGILNNQYPDTRRISQKLDGDAS